MFLLGFLFWLNFVKAFVHPISSNGKYFIDTVSNEPFFIKGIDYQPGGSSAVSNDKDPLSDPDQCARDILLFQDIGINTIRIYSINADLNHDACMSMLAAAGIYLVLDVNSPLPGHHLNRYEPWSSYNLVYLENVFKVVEQFSYYNNTLGFFAGNEIVNDEVSAERSPVYVKALIRDMKNYIDINSPRIIPVGYSAADDLKYRISFSQYLECLEESPADSVDFYGVNSYQWCGDQTFYSSGYSTLVSDYASYTRPVFFSEYGCNEVTPRKFGEVHTLYSNNMIDAFCGGLVYEYSQEPNNYGLVQVQANGDIKLLSDYVALKTQFNTLPEIDYRHVASSIKKNIQDIQNRRKIQRYATPPCEESYDNIDISKGIVKSLAEDFIEYGVEAVHGKYVPVDLENAASKFNIYDVQGKQYLQLKLIIQKVDYTSGIELTKNSRLRYKKYGSGTYDNDDESDCTSLEEDSSQGSESILKRAATYVADFCNSIIQKIYSH